jgi:hypothetical protein
VTSTPAAVSTASAAPPCVLAHPTLAQVPAWLLAFAVVLVLGADNGGYSPTTWGWSALVLFTVAALALVLRTELRLGRLEVAFALGLLAFFAWGLLSALWSPSPTQPLLESQRTLVYVAGALAALLLARSRSYHALLAGTWTAIVLVCSYSLLTRLVPDRLGFVQTIAGYRLAQPLGYWNALGISAACGTLLAFGFALRSRYLAARAVAAASTVPLVSTLYFTFSRGAWIALGAGLLVVLILDARRLQLISGLLVVAPWPALAVWRASGSDPLTHLGATLPAAAHAGHRFLVTELLLVAGAATAGLALGVLEPRFRPRRALRLAYAAAIVTVLAVGAAALVVRFGSPPTIARDLHRNIVGPSAVTDGNLNRRLFTLSGGQRIPQWKVAWREYEAHPWLGSGLGTYERWWNQQRPAPWKVRNVHNLYLETLAELGPVGLGMLSVGLGLPLVAAVRARRRALASAAAGTYVAFAAHAAVDWDWQLPAVTLAALFTGAALLVAARRPATGFLERRGRVVVLAGMLPLAAFAFVGLRGNQAIAAAEDAIRGDSDLPAVIAESRRAARWAPWSARPWQLRGDAELEHHRLRAARADLRRAAAKDPADWSIWLNLALASSGPERRAALDEAARLNPLDPVIASFGSR